MAKITKNSILGFLVNISADIRRLHPNVDTYSDHTTKKVLESFIVLQVITEYTFMSTILPFIILFVNLFFKENMKLDASKTLGTV